MSSKLSVPIYVIDAFTAGQNEAYTGNSAAVCFLDYDDEISDEIKQKIAYTMNLSETTFLSRDWTRPTPPDQEEKKEGSLKRNIRWFTPKHEIGICGHATFASAQALILTSLTPLKDVTFHSKSGHKLSAKIEKEGEDNFITLNFPISLQTKVSLDEPWLPKLSEIILGGEFKIGGHQFEDVQYSPSLSFLYLTIKTQDGESPLQTIRKVAPNYQQLGQASTGELGARAFIVTMEGVAGEGGVYSRETPHFYSRTFAPYFGITEDPVCGSAHTGLAPIWATKMGLHGKNLWAHQASPRSGDICCTIEGDRVTLKGRGRVVLEGELQV